jgi:hypothetical protein
MKNEMEILGMTGVERLCWLRANRITLMIVGVVWIGMIVERLTAGVLPLFLIAGLFGFAAIRFGLYRFFRWGYGVPEEEADGE